MDGDDEEIFLGALFFMFSLKKELGSVYILITAFPLFSPSYEFLLITLLKNL
jgi:hypothetical protein